LSFPAQEGSTVIDKALALFFAAQVYIFSSWGHPFLPNIAPEFTLNDILL
jgi:hypothetical protein